MKQPIAGGSFLRHVTLAAGVWAAGGLAYGMVEALTNSVAGLHQPLRIWTEIWSVYGVSGLVAGVVAGSLLFVWDRIWRRPNLALVPFLLAAFLGSLLFAYLAVPINDRWLPLLLSPLSIAVNGVLLACGVVATLVVHRHLRARKGTRLTLSAVNVTFFFCLCLAIGQYADSFVAVTMPTGRTVLLYAALLVGCTTLYVVTDRAGHFLGRAFPRRPGVAAATLVMVVAIGLGLKAWGTPRAATGGLRGDRPNILWIVMDTTRADHLSAYGYPRRTTPNVDAIAAEGTLFENAISQSSWTVPSHFQMVTSRYTAGRQSILDDRFVTAAEMLKAKGYDTGAVLANFVLGRRSGFEQGFDSVADGPVSVFCLSAFEKVPVIKLLLDLNLLPSDAVIRLLDRKEFLEGMGARADAVNAQASQWLKREGERPFFLFINYMDPHDPYDPPQPFRDRFAPGVDPEMGFVRYSREVGRSISSGRFVRDTLPKMSAEDIAKIVALYDGEVAYLDDQIGRLVATLKARGIYDRTLLIVTADHGELFGEHGLANHMKALSEEEIHVPLIMRYPAALPRGKRVNIPVELSDILPTVLELAGVAPGTPLDGKSLMPLVGEETAAEDDGWGETYSFLIRRPDRNYPFTSPGHLIGMRTPAFKYVWSSTGQHAFYDLVQDPHADHNIYGNSPEIVAAAQRLEDWRKKAGLENIDPNDSIDRLTKERLRALGYVQ